MGVNVTEIVHDALDASVDPQLFVCAKLVGFVPVMVMPEIVIEPAPVLVRVTTCAAPLVNESALAESAATGADVAAPVPATLMLWVALLLELSVTVRLAVRAPVDVGVNVTTMLQLAPTARVGPQVLVCEKSPGFVPVKAILEIVNAAVPEFVSVAVCGLALLAITVVANVKPSCGSSDASGAAPVPVR